MLKAIPLLISLAFHHGHHHKKKQIEPPPPATIELKGVTATIFEDRRVARSRRINPYEVVGVAMPTPLLLGETITVHSPDTGVSVEAEVVDVGPWSTQDHGILRGERPKAERGISDLKRYGHRAGNRAGVDLTPATRDALKLPEWEGTFIVDISIPRKAYADEMGE